MRKANKFLAFFNIQPGEEHLIGLLVLLAFALELALVLLQSMAFGLFLEEYGPQSLPYSYIVIAVFGTLAAVISIKVADRASFSTALMLNILFLGVFSTFTWVGLKSALYHPVVFILPLLSQISINFSYLVIWQLAGHLFNFQQAKRLFPLVIAGPWLADSIGGLLVRPLISLVGIINLLLPVIVLFGLAISSIHKIGRDYLSQHELGPHLSEGSGRRKQSDGFLRNRYILLIFAYVAFWFIASLFLDNIFADRAAAQFSSADQLATFRGYLTAVIGIVALFSTLILTGRIIKRFGIRVGLISEALAVTVIVGLLAIAGSLSGSLTVVFLLAVLAKLINIAFGLSLSQTAYILVYLPLADRLRVRAQATAEGIFQPIAGGLAGMSLLLLTSGLKFTYLGLSYVYLGVAVVLLVIVYRLGGSYIHALTQAITKRRLGESPVVFADPASRALLNSRLHDPHPAVAIYALTKLEALDSKSIPSVLPDLIRHHAPEVRREAYLRIETLKLRSAREAVRVQLDFEKVPFAKEAGFRAYGAITDMEAASPLLDALHETEPHLRRGALIGLLKYLESSTAEQVLEQLSVSATASDRRLAAQVLGETGQDRFLHMHQALLCDSDPDVRRDAIYAAARIEQPTLYPFLIEACDMPDTSYAPTQALITIGRDVFPAVETAFSQPDAPRQRLLTLCKVVARVGGTDAHALLRTRMNSSDCELRSRVLNALSECGYRTRDLPEIYTRIEMEIQAMSLVWAVLEDAENHEDAALLSMALHQFSTETRDRVLLLLSFAFDTSSLLRVREALKHDSTSQLTYALEILDAQLPPDWKPIVLPLFENVTFRERLKHLNGFFPAVPQTREERLRLLMEKAQEGHFTRWILVSAIYTAGELRTPACRDLILTASTDSNLLIRETACQALTRFTPELQGENNVLSTIEKVLILKTVNMFDQTPDDVLADVADLLEELDVSENEPIFKQGDPGDSMYIIVDGRVRVHLDERLLNYLGESDVFGEMALLDPEPRLASVTTVEPTRLFRLDQAPFFQLIAERPEIATGIIRVLTRLLRDRVHDLSLLDGRVKELERAISGVRRQNI